MGRRARVNRSTNTNTPMTNQRKQELIALAEKNLESAFADDVRDTLKSMSESDVLEMTDEERTFIYNQTFAVTVEVVSK